MAVTAAGLQLGFAGSPPFAAQVLRHLITTNNVPKLVLTQPDRPSGRGKKVNPSAVRMAASEAGIDVFTPTTLRAAEAVDRLSAARLDVLVVVAYGLILPREVLNLPARGCVNVHASLLPRWRGAAPIERAMLAGDARTGVSIMAMDEGLDTGPVYLDAETPILPTDTGDSLSDRLAGLGSELLVEVLGNLPSRIAVEQTDEGACYAAKLKPEEARIDWAEPAIDLARKIRAFNSRMPAFGYLDEQRIRFFLADAKPAPATADPGTILVASRRGLSIATGEGQLVITELAMARGKGTPMPVAAALNGHADLLAPGGRFDG